MKKTAKAGLIALYLTLLGAATLAAANGTFQVGSWNIQVQPPVETPPELEARNLSDQDIELTEENDYRSGGGFSLTNISSTEAAYTFFVGHQPNITISLDGRALDNLRTYSLDPGEEVAHEFEVSFNGDKTPEVYPYESELVIEAILVE